MTLILDGTLGASAVQPSSIQTDDLAPLAVTGPKMAGNQSGSAPIYGARAWAVFDGTTAVVAASGNVTGIVRNSAGVYTVTLTTAMSDANYAIVATCTQGATGYVASVSGMTATTFVIRVFGQAGTAQDATSVHFSIFR